MNIKRIAICLSALALTAGARGQAQETPPPLTVQQEYVLPSGDKVTVEVDGRVFIQQAPKPKEAPKEEAAPVTRKTAIIVENHAGKAFDGLVPRFGDQVAARVGGDAFEIINHRDVVTALSGMSAADRKLASETSALRLAQNLDADYLLVASLGSFDAETKRLKTAGMDIENKVYTLRGTYRLLDGATGGTLGGAPVRASKTVRQTATLQIDNSDMSAEMLEQLADKVAKDMLQKADTFRVASAAGSEVAVTVICQARDLTGDEISLPDLRVTEDNHLSQGDQALPLRVAAVFAVDGMAKGTTPATVRVKPGIHKLSLMRPGFEPVELTFTAEDKMELVVSMQMDAAGFARWVKIRDVLNALDTSRELTDAEAERLRGIGQMFRQSGFKVDATALPDVTLKSLF